MILIRKGWAPLVGAMMVCAASATAHAQVVGTQMGPEVRGEYRGKLDVVKFDVSPALKDMELVPPPVGPLRPHEGGAMVDPPSGLESIFGPGPQDTDLIVQWRTEGAGSIPAPTRVFDMVTGTASPPDPVGDVGPNHYVVMSNVSFAVYNKTGGAPVFGPAANNQLWAGFGGACQSENAGDPIVLHDQFADRWLLTQFTAAGPTYFICVALSTSPDPTGTYYRWAFSTGSNFPDYPKFGVWRDAYYFQTREFAGNTFAGIGAYAFNRQQAIAGNPNPTVISFVVSPAAAGGAFNIGDGLLPADVDGPDLPPVGAPSYWVGSMDNGASYGAPQDALTFWKFVADFNTPANSTFTLTHTIPIAAYDTIFPCSGRSCIPQPNTTRQLDILSYRQRPLHRLAYRNFGSHESLVTNQSVEAVTGMAGIRWWELRNPSTTPTVFQEGTYAPGATDGIHRWMGSIAQDGAGNMAMGYSVSNASVAPGIRYTGRLVSDTPGMMPRGEGTFVTGVGSKTNSERWGDYTSMNVDPADDCTFWYVNQYFPTAGSNTWTLTAGAFRFNECGTPTFTVGAGPSQATICTPQSAEFSVNVGSIAGFNSPVTLSASGVPASATSGFGTNPVIPGNSSLFTVSNTGAVAAGTYPITITGTQGATTRTSDVFLTVETAPPGTPSPSTTANGATGLSTSPTLTWAAVAGASGYTVEVATDAGFANIVRTANVTGTSYTVAPGLDPQTTYHWRVRSNNSCGAGSNSTVRSFSTANIVCYAGAPVPIPDNNPAGANATINVSSGGNVSALRVSVGVTHTFVGDLIITLTKGATSAEIINRPTSCSGDNIAATFFDASANAPNTCVAGPPAIGGDKRPLQAFTAFDGQPLAGTWTLNVADRAGVDVGTIDSVCFELPAGNPDGLFANGFE